MTSRPLYISLDKDVLRADYAPVNWDSGHLREAEVNAVRRSRPRRLTTLLGPTHAHTLGCAANLALDMMAAGDEQGGKELQDKTLQLLTDTYGKGSPDYEAAATRSIHF